MLSHLLYIHHYKGPQLIDIYLFTEVWANSVDPEQNAVWLELLLNVSHLAILDK